jgi:hypothetical protein
MFINKRIDLIIEDLKHKLSGIQFQVVDTGEEGYIKPWMR